MADQTPQAARADTLAQAMSALREAGYTENLTPGPDGLIHSAEGKPMPVYECAVDEIHRFEGESNPSDMAILYALSNVDGRKGLLVNAYGTYADAETAAVLRQVESRHREGL